MMKNLMRMGVITIRFIIALIIQLRAPSALRPANYREVFAEPMLFFIQEAELEEN